MANSQVDRLLFPTAYAPVVSCIPIRLLMIIKHIAICVKIIMSIKIVRKIEERNRAVRLRLIINLCSTALNNYSFTDTNVPSAAST